MYTLDASFVFVVVVVGRSGVDARVVVSAVAVAAAKEEEGVV